MTPNSVSDGFCRQWSNGSWHNDDVPWSRDASGLLKVLKDHVLLVLEQCYIHCGHG